jgi:hypothetical protein
MRLRSAAVTLATVVALAAPLAARADNLPINLGLGLQIPTAPQNAVETNYAQGPGGSVQQTGNVAVELTVTPPLVGNYQFSGLLLTQHETVNGGPFFPSYSEDITQIPVLVEGTTAGFGPVKLGGGLGYDFVSYPNVHGSAAGSSVVGDVFGRVALGSSGTALEAKYIFGQRSALTGIFAGVLIKL